MKHSVKQAARNHRKWTRYKPDPMAQAQFDVKNRRGKFCPTHNLLLLSESFKGCGGVISADIEIQVGDLVTLKVGELEPFDAEVRWIEKLDPQVFKIGFMYLD